MTLLSRIRYALSTTKLLRDREARHLRFLRYRVEITPPFDLMKAIRADILKIAAAKTKADPLLVRPR